MSRFGPRVVAVATALGYVHCRRCYTPEEWHGVETLEKNRPVYSDSAPHNGDDCDLCHKPVTPRTVNAKCWRCRGTHPFILNPSAGRWNCGGCNALLAVERADGSLAAYDWND